MANRRRKTGSSDRLYFLVLQITADGDQSHKTKRHLLFGRKAMINRDITFVCIVKATAFPGVMYGCKSWIKRKLSTKELMLSNCGAGEHSLRGRETCKEIKPVNLKGNQAWIFIGRTNTEALILWTSYAKRWLIRKNPDAGKDWRQKEKRGTEDEMVR